MARRWLCSAFLLALFFGQASGQESDLSLSEGVKAHKEIDGIYHTFSDAYRRLDAGLVSNLYAEKALYLQPDDEIMKGRESIHKVFERYFDWARKNGKQLEISFEIVERRVSGDLAYDIGIFRLTTSNKDSVEHSGRGKFFVIASKEEKGTWRFQVDGYSNIKNKK